MVLYCPSSPTAVEIGELNKPNLLLEPIRSVSCRIVDLCAYISLIIFIVIILIEYDFEMYFMLSSFDRFLCLLFGWAVGVCYFCCFYFKYAGISSRIQDDKIITVLDYHSNNQSSGNTAPNTNNVGMNHNFGMPK